MDNLIDQLISKNEVSEKHGLERLTELTKLSFYKEENWFDNMCNLLFKIKERETTVKAECFYGVIHFISCLYALAIIPQQLESAGYSTETTVVSVAFCSGVGSIFLGLFANLPFVMAPPAVVAIYLSSFLQQNNIDYREGNIAVILSGVLLMIFGWRPLGVLTARLIPLPIQVGSAVGIGLLTALSGSTEIDLVVRGDLTVLTIGKITNEICIAISGVVIVSVALNYHVKGAFCIAVIFCSLLWWIIANDFPASIAGEPEIRFASINNIETKNIPLLVLDLVFLYLLYLNGIVTSLSNLAVLTRKDGATPRGRWIFILSGIFTIIGGLLCSAPVLVSPESSASIKAGARTGLSTVVCGFMFIISLFFFPIFQKVPAAGTSPILIMIGVILFQNVNRIDWRNVSDAAPAFVVLFYIPFTYSVIQGFFIFLCYIYLFIFVFTVYVFFYF
jgi:AGZA family xanthine/uracil permease-like MFS transporter